VPAAALRRHVFGLPALHVVAVKGSWASCVRELSTVATCGPGCDRLEQLDRRPNRDHGTGHRPPTGTGGPVPGAVAAPCDVAQCPSAPDTACRSWVASARSPPRWTVLRMRQDVLVSYVEVVMAVALLFTPTSMTAARYDRVVERLKASGVDAPAGRRFHACFGPGHRLTMFEVWDTMEEFQAFASTLMPILAEEQVELAPPEPLEIHSIIEGGDASTLRKRIDALLDQAFFRRPVEKLRDRLYKSSESGAMDKLREKIRLAKDKSSGEENVDEPETS
jgi:hypothetical protein